MRIRRGKQRRHAHRQHVVACEPAWGERRLRLRRHCGYVVIVILLAALIAARTTVGLSDLSNIIISACALLSLALQTRPARLHPRLT
jgi:hypothetical protein